MTAKDILKIAQGELGIAENPANSNNVKYNTAYYGHTVNGSAWHWCAVFVWWVFQQAGASALYYGGQKTASCTTLMEYYRKNGQLVKSTDYQQGDIVFWQFNTDAKAEHVGIVESVSNNSITDIEGNTAIGNDANGGMVMRRTRSRAQVLAVARPAYAKEAKKAVYSLTNGVHIIAVPAEELKIVMVDKAKKSAAAKNYANAGFFGNYTEKGNKFTLPCSHVVCDFAAGAYPLKYCSERGTFNAGKKLTYETFPADKQFYGKKQTTLLIKDGIAQIAEVQNIGNGWDYAIAGVPVMRNGEDVIFKTTVTQQGWGGGVLYATWHTFVGLKKGDNKTVYVMGAKTKTANMISKGEAYKLFKSLGFYDVIKLDGGGSFHFNVNGRVVATTTENRRINTVLAWSDTEVINPYPEPTTTLRKGSIGNGVKWLQWQLNSLGYNCGNVDGIFGNGTLSAVKSFQKAHKLTVDGVVGSATRSALKRI